MAQSANLNTMASLAVPLLHSAEAVGRVQYLRRWLSAWFVKHLHTAYHVGRIQQDIDPISPAIDWLSFCSANLTNKVTRPPYKCQLHCRVMNPRETRSRLCTGMHISQSSWLKQLKFKYVCRNISLSAPPRRAQSFWGFHRLQFFLMAFHDARLVPHIFSRRTLRNLPKAAQHQKSPPNPQRSSISRFLVHRRFPWDASLRRLNANQLWREDLRELGGAP